MQACRLMHQALMKHRIACCLHRCKQPSAGGRLGAAVQGSAQANDMEIIVCWPMVKSVRRKQLRMQEAHSDGMDP